MIEPIQFGESCDLFGIYHPARGFARGHALLIAGPLLNEAMRAHSALRQIAERAAKSGYDVLRFDYAGMGNSAGDLESVHVTDWVSNFENALIELRRRSGATEVSVLAVRLSANFALNSCAGNTFQNVLLWDPVFDGSGWLTLLRHAQSKLLEAFPEHEEEVRQVFLGHTAGPGFIDELRELNLQTNLKSNVFAVTSSNYPFADEVQKIADVWQPFEFAAEWEKKASQVLRPHDLVDALIRVLK